MPNVLKYIGKHKQAWEGGLARIDTKLIYRDPEIMSGAPVFAGTRVPVQTLFDWIEDGETLDFFLENFPTVSRKYTVEVLELYKELLLAEAK